jgi:hypothetical protein
VDLPYVVDYLRQEAGARAVVATSSGFGWEDLYVQCVSLYVDADTTQSLAESAAVQPTPTIILEGKLIHATTNMEAATQLVEGPDLDKLAISERKSILRQNWAKSRRVIHNIGPFMHGQSISLKGAETKGSVAVFLSPEDETEKRAYALTACHVVPSISATETQVITPGGLNILTRMLEVQPLPARHKELDFLLERWNNKCGEVRHRHIGTNGNDWRSDWALVCLENEWKGENGSWMNDEMTDFYIQINRGTSEEKFTGSNGIITCVDAMADTICYKDGAATGCTAGRVGSTEALIFRKGTAKAITEEEIQERHISPNEVDRARCVTVHPIGSEKDVALPGDSGCGVFCPVLEKDGWSWVGQFVSIFYKKKGESVVLMVPQSEILHSLREVTGKSWLLSVKNT